MKIALILVISMYFVYATMAEDAKYICKQTVESADPPPVTAPPAAHAAGPPPGHPAGPPAARRRRALSSKDSERKCLACLWQTAMPSVPENQACLDTKDKVTEWTTSCADEAKKCWLCHWDHCNVNETTAKGKKPESASVGISLLPKAWLGLVPVVAVLVTQMSALY